MPGRIRKCTSTLLRGISSRTTVKTMGLGVSSRNMVMWTVVPLGPLSRSATSSVFRLSVGLPSTAMITSPGLMPARYAGLPANGAIVNGLIGIHRLGIVLLHQLVNLGEVTQAIIEVADGGGGVVVADPLPEDHA